MKIDKLWYAVLERDGKQRYWSGRVSVYNSAHLEEYAELCAGHYHQQHGGWEADWPLTFVLYGSETGPELARFTVERETRPEFRAVRCRPKPSEKEADSWPKKDTEHGWPTKYYPGM